MHQLPVQKARRSRSSDLLHPTLTLAGPSPLPEQEHHLFSACRRDKLRLRLAIELLTLGHLVLLTQSKDKRTLGKCRNCSSARRKACNHLSKNPSCPCGTCRYLAEQLHRNLTSLPLAQVKRRFTPGRKEEKFHSLLEESNLLNGKGSNQRH